MQSAEMAPFCLSICNFPEARWAAMGCGLPYLLRAVAVSHLCLMETVDVPATASRLAQPRCDVAPMLSTSAVGGTNGFRARY